MRPNKIDDYYDHDYDMIQARDRAEDLRESWRTANYSSEGGDRKQSKPHASLVWNTREAAARWLIGVGQRVLPGDVQPCD